MIRIAGLEIPTASHQHDENVILLTMSFIDLQSFDALLRVPVFELMDLLLWGIPEASVINGRNIEILGHSLNPDRDSIDAFSRRQSHGDLDHGVVGNSAYTGRSRWDITFPHPKG